MRRDSIIFVLLLVLTTFEYFFRAEMLSWILYFLAGIIFLTDQSIRAREVFNRRVVVYLVISIFFFLIQTMLIDHLEYTSFISKSIAIIGPLIVASIVERRAVAIYVRVMYWITIVSLIIYALCFNPEIQKILLELTKKFVSMNVEDAVFEGGGANIVIYNFQGNRTLEGLGIRRNCGPFWEPGQFGVYLCIALFFNLFIEKQRLRFANLFFVIALLTTCSTGAYMAGFFMMAVYAVLKSRNVIVMLLSLFAIALVWQQVSELEFLQEKITTQIEDVETGNDLSRFSAFVTQLDMINNSPILGGEKILDYVDTDDGTLASGTLMPFVLFGIPFGIFYYVYLCVSCCGIACVEKRKIVVGTSFFILLLILSFSQTILTVPVIVTLMFVGLMRIKN